jgi:glycosyltransferase involved in cell wall biosynthesis
MRVVGFGTYDLTKHPRAGIVLSGFRACGDDVVEVNAPLGFSTAERVAMLSRPWLSYRLAVRLLRHWITLAQLARAARRGGPVDLVVVGYLGHFDVLLARILFRRATIALDLMIFAADTARDRGVRAGLMLRLLDGLDKLAVRAADIVLLDTDEHLALLPEASHHKGVVVAVGAPDEWFDGGSSVPRDTAIPPLTVIFFGLYTPLQGATVIGAALALLAGRPDIEITMVGTGQELDATRAAAAGNASVRWRDWVAAADLPALVAGHDVCLGIFGTTPKAARVVPNKVYQGAAAGCAIVTSDTPAQRRALGDAALYVPPGDARLLAATLMALAEDGAAAREYAARAADTARQRFRSSEIVVPLRERLAGNTLTTAHPGVLE